MCKGRPNIGASVVGFDTDLPLICGCERKDMFGFSGAEEAAAAARSVEADGWNEDVDCLYAKCGIMEETESEVAKGRDGAKSGDVGEV